MENSIPDMYIEPIRSFTRTGAVACACFLLGILFLTDNFLFPQGNYLVFGISLGVGVLLPLFLGINKVVARLALVSASGFAAIATVLLINGIALPVAIAMLFVALPCVAVFGFSQAMVGGGDPASWRRGLVAMVLALCFVVLARSVKIAPFATWNGLYAIAAMFVANAVVSGIKVDIDGDHANTDGNVEDPPSHPLGVKGLTYFIAGIAMAGMAGVVAFVPGFLGDIAWVDPNPMAPGVPREMIDRPWAPWDTVTILAVGVTVAALALWYLQHKPGRSLLVSTCLFSGFCVAWLMAWSSATFPIFIWSMIGIPCYLGAVTSLLLFLARWFKPPRPDAWQMGERPVVGGMTRRAWLLAIPFLGSAAPGLMFRDIFNWSMVMVPVMVIIPVIAGAAILILMWILHAVRGRAAALPAMPFRVHGSIGKWRVDAAVVVFLIFGGFYAASYATYHAPFSGHMVGLYAWGGGIGSWAPDVEGKVTHATVFALDLDTTTGSVSSAWVPANNTPYQARGIKVMPTVFLAFADLYYMLKNAGGRLDTFVTTLRATLVATGVDGVSIDFEMLETPPGSPRVTNEEWILAWERISFEACHGGGNGFLLGVYWQVNSQYTRDQVNRYFRAVDIHVENMYETHRQTGSQGSTTVIEVSVSNVIETYALLDDKAMMAKVMPGLPVYHYVWIDGMKGALNESLIVPGGNWWWFHSYPTLEQVMVANGATFRWDPFSGATWARFTMALQDNRTVTVVAYLHDAAHLARTMHVMEGYGITGIMLWPAHQPAPPSFIETFYT
ncbi:MAG: hypothetical protein JW839_11775 [Candidatus Lokiarchaeota archaeon]|nr:hypothetical protein [Candidatus Lokiarchaeota archaeon]